MSTQGAIVQIETIRKDEEVWGSRTAFYFAAIGSAVGFGNVWRFPALSVQFGGGAFLIPYFMAVFILGIPILTLEIAFGQYWQSGDVGTFGSFSPRLAGVGISSVACGYMLLAYYSMLTAWVVHAFFDSFKTNPIWTDPDVDGSEAIDYFLNEIIGMSTLGEDGRATRLVWANVGCSAFVWVLVFLCIAFGTKMTGKIAYITMGLPVIMLFIFLGKAVSLPGASDGLQVYMGEWDMSVLRTQGQVWSLAAGQVFFSLSITFGIMTAYGAHCRRNEPALLNSVVIAMADTSYAILAGVAVFAALGHLAYLEGVPVTDLSYGGFSLVFGTWPVVLGQLPGGIHWVRLLFLNLFFLGIDSAFSFLEGAVTVVCDTKRFQHVAKWKVVGFFCVLGWLISCLYATDAGLSWLDVIDYYINFVMIAVGLMEAFGAGWVYGINDQIERVGSGAVYSWMILANFLPIIIACSLWFGLKDNAVWAGFVGLFATAFVGILTTAYFLNKEMKKEPGKWTWSGIWWETTFGNVFRLRDIVQPVVQYLPDLWAFLIKGLVPHILIILFVNAAASNNADGSAVFGNYGGYSTRPYQVLGVLAFVFAAVLVLVGFAFPQLYEAYNEPDENIVRQFNEAEAALLGNTVKDEEVIKEVSEKVLENQEHSDGSSEIKA